MFAGDDLGHDQLHRFEERVEIHYTVVNRSARFPSFPSAQTGPNGSPYSHTALLQMTQR